MVMAIAIRFRYKWDFAHNNCSIGLRFEDLASAAVSLNLCYYPLLLSTLSSIFALVFFAGSLFDSSLERNKRGNSSRSARWVCGGLLLLYVLLLLLSVWEWWQTSWSYLPFHELVYYASQLLLWLSVSVSVQQRQYVLRSTQLKIWWLFLFGLSSAAVAVAILKSSLHEFSYILNAALFCVPSLSSLFFLALPLVQSHSSTELNTPLLKDASLVVISPAAPPPQGSGFTTAGLFSRITFRWLNPLLTTGNQKPLHIHDVPALDPEDDNNYNFREFQRSWEADETINSGLPSIWRALWRAFWGPFTTSILLSVIWSFALFTGPILQNLLINFANGEKRQFGKGLMLVGILFTGKVVESSSKQQFNFRSRKLGLRIWSAVGCKVYEKTLRLSLQARQDRSVGEITNILSSDAERLLESMWYLGQGIAVPVQITFASILLFKVVGISMVGGLVTIFIVLGINLLVVRKMRGHKIKVMFAKDRRMQVTSECLGNMRMVKLQAWDERFREKILDAREKEQSCLLRYVYNLAVSICVTWVGPLAVGAVTFLIMIRRGEVLTTATVLTALTTIRIIQEPIRFCPDIFSNVLQTIVSIHRVNGFLCEDEIDLDAVEVGSADRNLYAVEMEDASFVWARSKSSKPAISNVKLKIKRGTCVAICGGVGSGKSTLLLSMLGELPRIAGVVRRAGRSAYVAQTAWLQNNTIRENILFGRDFELESYNEAVRVSGLQADLARFPDGDSTEIGEKGINMSGGQKQRIQLARAVYQDADTYFLDDPFSAVDAHTGTYLFQECIQGALKGKTVILVTHQVEFLPATNLIIVMKEGEIVQKGSYSELVQQGKYFGTFVGALQDSLNSVTHATGNELQENTKLGLHDSSQGLQVLKAPSNDRPEQKSARNGKLIMEEERLEGSVGSKVIRMYATKLYHGCAILITVVLQVAAIGSQMGSDIWIAWAPSHGKGGSLSTVEVYCVFVIVCGSCVLVRAFLVLQVGVWTAQAFFTGMLDSVIRAPTSFLDSTPVGRILSRSSTDQASLDLELPMVVSQITNSSIAILFVLGLTTFITPPVIGIVIFLAWFFFKLQMYYIKSARELSRLTAISEAPVILHVNESISGASTIRAFEDQSRFKMINSKLFNNYQRAYFHNLSATAWLGLRLEFLAALVLSSSALLIITLPADSIAPGMTGLSVSYGLALSGLLQMLVNALSSLENKMVSVERINQYSNIESEAPAIVPDQRPPGDWPKEGRIQVQNLEVCQHVPSIFQWLLPLEATAQIPVLPIELHESSRPNCKDSKTSDFRKVYILQTKAPIRYQPDMPLVLNGVSFVIHPREKVGVVGRTGSGKSTIIQALFRLIEPAGGQILIDGIDITSIGLHDLRSRLAVIPQEPMLFEGTIRSNLDPFNAYSDQQLWEALEKCALATAIRSKPGKLDAAVSEQGENWSQGERQLLCLGRALLKHARILVLDEATASVDISTDAIIQSTIKQNLADCTIISVAHRIPTVMDSDRVIVLDSGFVRENNSPQQLLANDASLFAKLVQEYRARNNPCSNSSDSGK